ncbi:MAG: NADH-quinone oxidoreductase subunit N [Anaerolineae bacterium]|nr:NADH-quinone oxidoreductase subunit N [Anaerolineae bacterium]
MFGAENNIQLYQIVAPILPEIGLLILLLIVLSADLFLAPSRRRSVGIVAAVGSLIVMAANLFVGLGMVNDPVFAQPVLGGMLRYDMLALIFRTMVLLAGGLTCLIALDVPKLGQQGEFHAIVLVATMGMSLMSAASDLIMVFLALETTSISLYILAGFLRDTPQSAEAGIKYYLFGAFTAGLFLYGLSLLYGFTGVTNIYALAEPLGRQMLGDANGSFALALALLLLVAGFGFKIAAVPFHFWTPDVYQGAPTPVTAFISTASKAASFVLLVRVFGAVWPEAAAPFWMSMLAAMATITMTLGNLLALIQRDIKRMLAYSSVAQAGYTLMGVVALQSDWGIASVAFYMFMYVLTNITAFTVVIIVSNATGSDAIKDFAGLSRRSPNLALAMVLALLSLSGVPPLAGFFGKFFLFAAAVDAGYVWLAIVAVLNAIVALYYYLTVIKVMYVDETEDTSPIHVTQAHTAVLAITGAGILIIGTVAGPWLAWAISAADSVASTLP